jgi:hypothetical protein
VVELLAPARSSAALSGAIAEAIRRAFRPLVRGRVVAARHRHHLQETEMRSFNSRAAISGLNNGLEATVDHAIAVKRHVLRIAHSGDARVFHHLGIHGVTMRA